MAVIDSFHEHVIFSRRVKRLSQLLADAIPVDGVVLDVGCGDGQISRLIASSRPGITIEGIDVLVRPHTEIPVQTYDGSHFPYPSASVDVVMLVDVLHHTPDPTVVLAEAARVARTAVVIKDHTLEGPLAYPTLRAMDWVGNSRHGVVLPYNYWTQTQWNAAFEEVGLQVMGWDTDLHLYAAPLRPLFERSLHFIGVLKGHHA